MEKILGRFANPHLPDTVDRVGRAPLRKLSRHERFIGPAAELAERGISPEALLRAMAAALRLTTRRMPRRRNWQASSATSARRTRQPKSPG